MKIIPTSHKQSGAVSLFVVVFAMLLMSVVTISFLRIMTKDESQSSGNDLAQSAYDSAQAGVEDAKRALVWYTEQCKISTAACEAAEATVINPECNQAIRTINGITGSQAEIKVQQSTSVDETTGESVDSALDQAYTCVKMNLDTPDYLASVPQNSSVLVPLFSTKPFNSVTVQWFSDKDLTTPSAAVNLDDVDGSAQKPLYRQSDWSRSTTPNRPSLLRAQLMQVGSTFRLSDFDTTTSDGKSNTNTVFLYPSSSGVNNTEIITRDLRAGVAGGDQPASTQSTPLPTQCITSVQGGRYSCSIRLDLPVPVGAANRNTVTSYLRLTAFYRASHIRVTLGDGAMFKGVQPVVDATGRASNVFRRVESRIDLRDTTTFPYPDAAVETSSNFCKDFGVTDAAYLAGACTP